MEKMDYGQIKIEIFGCNLSQNEISEIESYT